MSEPKHVVFLAGFMGSGKSTIGPRLARTLDCDFVDIDDLIEEIEGVSISELFKKFGERHFRKIEKRVLCEICRNNKSLVVALGGGTLTHEENRLIVRNGGTLVYLKADPRNIFERVRSKQNRPMLLAPDGSPLGDKELLERIESLLREREKHYMEASVIVSTSELGIERSVEEIVQKLQGRTS